VLVLKSGFFNTPIAGQLCPSLYTFFPRQSISPIPIQKSFEQKKEMTFDRRLANITAPVVCPSSQNLVKRPCIKSR